MIESFRDRGLKELFEKGASRRVRPDLHKRTIRAMDALDKATKLSDLSSPGLHVHPLTGTDRHAMSVSGPWRITFRWEAPNAHELDREQYH